MNLHFCGEIIVGKGLSSYSLQQLNNALQKPLLEKAYNGQSLKADSYQQAFEELAVNGDTAFPKVSFVPSMGLPGDIIEQAVITWPGARPLVSRIFNKNSNFEDMVDEVFTTAHAISLNPPTETEQVSPFTRLWQWFHHFLG